MMLFTHDEIEFCKKYSIEFLQRERERERERELYIMGTGSTASDLYRSFKTFKIPVKGFVTSNGKGTFKSLPIYHLSELDKMHSQIVVVGRYAREMMEMCQQYGIPYLFPRQFAPQQFIAYACHPMQLDEIINNNCYISLYNLLCDDISRKTLKDILIYRITLKPEIFFDYEKKAVNTKEYFPDDIKSTIDYHYFFDAGAFDGDTYLSWKEYTDFHYSDQTYYYGIEAYPDNYLKLSNICSQHNTLCINKAISNSVGDKIFYQETDNYSGAIFNNIGEYSIMTDTVDNILQGNKITCLKADIEGCELDMLDGAVNTIRKYRPSLLFAAYHNISDIFAIPFRILSICDSYKIYLRHYGPGYCGSTIYALPCGDQ